jgi:hypothetical protein
MSPDDLDAFVVATILRLGDHLEVAGIDRTSREATTFLFEFAASLLVELFVNLPTRGPVPLAARLAAFDGFAADVRAAVAEALAAAEPTRRPM